MASTITPVIQAEERAQIVAWLRSYTAMPTAAAMHMAANVIEAGEHLK
jgi:hypothetical protein